MHTADDLIAKVLRFQLFQEMEQNPEGLRELAGLMKVEVFPAREYIISESQQDPRMFFLLSGQVEINKMNERGEIVVLGRIDAKSNPYFGESILVGNFKRSANVVAYAHCECLSLEASQFQALMKTYPAIVASIYRNLSRVLFERLAKANRDAFIAGMALKK